MACSTFESDKALVGVGGSVLVFLRSVESIEAGDRSLVAHCASGQAVYLGRYDERAEAQHALAKVMQEVDGGTQFIFVPDKSEAKDAVSYAKQHRSSVSTSRNRHGGS